MAKLILITHCDDCPFFDNEYHDYASLCEKLDKFVEHNESYDHPIPEWCPLDDNAPNKACTGLAGTEAADSEGSKPASQ